MRLNEEKKSLQARMETLAEKYEDMKDKQEIILKRFASLIDAGFSGKPRSTGKQRKCKII